MTKVKLFIQTHKRWLIIAAAVLLVISGYAYYRHMAKEEPYNLEREMRSMSRYLGDKGTIVDVDVTTLDKFFKSVDNVKYRLRGMVTDYKEKPSLFYENKKRYTCDLLCSNDMRVSVYFKDDEGVADGEYVEIVGELLTIGMGSSDRTCFSIYDASIVERGASVRERVESEH